MGLWLTRSSMRQDITRILHPDNWDRFDLYATWIHSISIMSPLRLSGRSLPNLSASIALRPEGHILPVLECLSIDSTLRQRVHSLQAMACLLNSQPDNIVRRLEIRLAGNLPQPMDVGTSGYLNSLLAALSSGYFQRLTRLSLRHAAGPLTPEADERAMRDTLGLAISRTPSLSDVALGSGWQYLAVLKALSCLPALSKLALCNWSTHGMQVYAVETSQCSGSEPSRRFPNLETLRVSEEVIRLLLPSLTVQFLGDQLITHLPSTSHIQPLRSLDLTYDIDLEPDLHRLQPCGQRTAVIHLISYFHKTLEDLSISLTCSSPFDIVSFLAPITSCALLRHLDVWGFLAIGYPQTLDPLIDHFPLLETLRWEPGDVDGDTTPSLGLDSLSALSIKCPRLSHIRIPLDAGGATPGGLQYRPLVNIEVLDVEGWTIKAGDVERLSHMLLTLGPSSLSFSRWIRGVPENGLVWSEALAIAQTAGSSLDP